MNLDAVWNIWRENLVKITEGWHGVRLERSTACWDDLGIVWENVQLDASVKVESDSPAIFFTPSYRGTVSWKLLSKIEWSVSSDMLYGDGDGDSQTLHQNSLDLTGLEPAAIEIAIKAAAREVMEWLKEAQAKENQDVV
jgi:hypothetical protein